MIGPYNHIHEELSRCHVKNDTSKRKYNDTSKHSPTQIHRSKTRKGPKTQSDAFVVEQQSDPPDPELEEKAKRETYRLASFKKCKIAVPPYDLAMVGFYYVGPGDKVRCFSCGNCVQSWKPKDDVSSKRWHASDCKHFFKKGSDNISIGNTSISSSVTATSASTSTPSKSSSTESTKLSTETKDIRTFPTISPPPYSFISQQTNPTLPHHPPSASLDVQPGPSTIVKPVQGIGAVYQLNHRTLLESLQLDSERDRRKTFTPQWPVDLQLLVRSLAKTGFFYLGNADRTQCFSCGAVQKNWLVTDDVHKVHAEMFKECRMIRNTEQRNVPLEEELDVRAPPVFVPIRSPRSEPSYDIYSAPPSRTSLAKAVLSSRAHSQSPNIYSTASPSLDHHDITIRGPPLYHGPDDNEGSRVTRQISQISNETLHSSLEGAFTTPGFSTESGDLTLDLPVGGTYYSNVVPRCSYNVNRISPSSLSTSALSAGETFLTSTSNRSAFEPISSSASKFIRPSSSSGDLTIPKSPDGSAAFLLPSATTTNAISTNVSSPNPPFSTPKTAALSPSIGNTAVSLTARNSEPAISSVAAVSLPPAVPSYRHPVSPLHSASGLLRVSPSSSMLPASSNLYVAPSSGSFTPISTGNSASPPVSFLGRFTGTGASTDTTVALSPIVTPAGVNVTIHQFSGAVSTASSGAASSNAAIVTSSTGSMATASLLLPTVISSSAQASTSINRAHSQPAPQSRIDEQGASSSSASWLRDLDPLAAVTGSVPAQPVQAPLPESELDVDDGYIDMETKVSLRDLYPCKEPARRDMVYLSQRTYSFRVPWPENNTLSPIPDVAKAGFYYQGVSDHVCCWYCGIEAKDWASKHSVWEMHALLYPSCHYLLRNRGLGFVETVLSQVAESRSPSPESQAASYQSSLDEYPSFSGHIESGPSRLPTPPIVDPRQEAEEREAELRRSMQSPMVTLAVGMGFTRNHVRQVLKKQIEEFSCSFQSSEALINELIMTPEDLIDLNSEGGSSGEQLAASSREASLFEEVDDDLDLYRGSESTRVTQPVGASGAAVKKPSTPQRSRGAKSAPKEGGTSNRDDLEEELLRLQHQKRCKVCLDRDADMVFIPCGHICACMQCTGRLKQCPLCRRRINKAYKTY